MMNRGKLEEWVVRLHMIRNRNRIPKQHKEEAQRISKVRATKLTEQTLIDRIESYLIALEVM